MPSLILLDLYPDFAQVEEKEAELVSGLRKSFSFLNFRFNGLY